MMQTGQVGNVWCLRINGEIVSDKPTTIWVLSALLNKRFSVNRETVGQKVLLTWFFFSWDLKLNVGFMFTWLNSFWNFPPVLYSSFLFWCSWRWGSAVKAGYCCVLSGTGNVSLSCINGRSILIYVKSSDLFQSEESPVNNYTIKTHFLS